MMPGLRRGLAPAGCAATALLLGAAAMASGPAVEAAGGTAVAESKLGNGTVTGPIRQGKNGLEVRLPSGRWIDCRMSCSETLRVETVDFWQVQGQTTNQCGILGCLKLTYPSR